MRPGEFDLIERYFAPLAANCPGAAGLRDDLAVLTPSSGCELALTVDAMVAGVHFLPDDPPDLIARKVLRANLSDIASSGARPRWYFLSMGLNDTVDEKWIAAFAAGLAHDQEVFGIVLAGGDTTATPGPVTLSVTAVGEVAKGGAVRRGGAKAGQDVWVTGTIGDAAIALSLIERTGQAEVSRMFPALLGRYRVPVPRVGLGPELVGKATAMADISDGLVADLGHICAASTVGAEIEFAKIPLSPEVAGILAESAAGAEENRLRILTGGDDYELLFTAPKEAAGDILAAAHKRETPVARIGVTTEGNGVRVIAPDGVEIGTAEGGWRHF